MTAGQRLPSTPAPARYWEGEGGVKLAGDVWGDPSGPLVILQHGGGQTRHAWKGTGETLGAAGYYAVAFDARGHGDSDWAPDGQYGQDLMVADLQHVVAALGGRRPVLVGASMGGGTSLVAVGEDHVDASALVLVDIAPRIEPDGVAKIQAFMSQRPDGFGSLDEVADAIASYQPHRQRPRNLDGLAKNVRLGDDGRYRWHWDPRFRPGTRDLGQRQARLEECARSLTLPTLLVRGGLSDILSEEGREGVPGAVPERRVRERRRRRPHGGRRSQRHLRRRRDRVPPAASCRSRPAARRRRRGTHTTSGRRATCSTFPDPSDTFALVDQQVVLITGASRGFGAAAARRIAAAGPPRRRHHAESGARRARRPRRPRGRRRGRCASTSPTRAEVERVVAATLERHGRIDVVVNNAGYGLYGPVECGTEEQLWRQLDTNTFGPLRVIRAVLPSMRARGRGKIVNVTSLSGRHRGADARPTTPPPSTPSKR